MKLRIVSLLTMSLIASGSHAASEQMVWGKANEYILGFKAFGPTNRAPAIHYKHQTKKSIYQLKALDLDTNFDPNNVRYQMYYREIPIWGHELILHNKVNNQEGFITGIDVTGIEKDLDHIDGKLSAQEAENKVLTEQSDKIIYKNTDKIIYLDLNKKAHLAYEVSMYTNNLTTIAAAPHYIIDADSGEVLKKWDELNHEKIGQGLGGNVFVLPYRSGLFQHGLFEENIPSLGKFDVEVKDNKCLVQNSDLRVINAALNDMDMGSFPVLNAVEYLKELPTFSYPCNAASNYINKNDGNTAPANFSFSAVNDTMYFAGVTLDMYRKLYGIEKPLGDDLPLRAYTHVKNFDNAFAVPTIKIKGIYLIHQQIVIGDGDKFLTAPAQSVIAHELSHNVTRLYSNLKYSSQSGGINEAFSDMAAIAMQDYLRHQYPWYWDGFDWSLGSEATIGSNPIRYMDEPKKDGKSIDNANQFQENLNVHFSSGVFNKAFYLLAHKPGWSVRKAFRVMVDANKKYWISSATFNAASCGVIQAAIDRKYNKQAVIESFKEVGVVCPLRSLSA